MSQLETPVLIVGAGPAGLTTALALARYGVEHLVVERYPGTAHTPRAHIVNQRTVEIMRHLGVEEDLKAVSTPHDMMRHNLWFTTLNKREVARLECWGTPAFRYAEYTTVSPSPMLNCPQTTFEPMLLEGVRRAGSDVAFQHEFVTMERDGDFWVSTIRNHELGRDYTVRSRYVIGADGARTKVLGLAGLGVEGPAGLFHAANIWFKADLSKYFAHRPGILSWNLHPGPQPPLGLGTFICHVPFSEFVLVRFYDPTQQDLSTMTDQEAIAYVEAAVGEPVEGIEVLGVSGWQVNAQAAPVFGKDGVFCMGDAVHRHPPTSGLGLNMSVADAYNLAWKLALVEKGLAGPALLDTYSTERQPVDQAGVQRAMTSLQESQAFHTALGLEPGLSEAEGWAALAQLDQPSPEGDARRAALRKALEVSNFQFNALGIELGYHYDNGALVHDDTPYAPPAHDPILHFQVTTRPGARVPHARIERDGEALSTLDLVDDLGFTLFVGLDSQAWSRAAAEVAAATGVAIAVHHVGGEEILDPYFEWADAREVGHDGAVLVRPDRHVAWRSLGAVDDPVTELGRVLSDILGLPGSASPSGT